MTLEDVMEIELLEQIISSKELTTATGELNIREKSTAVYARPKSITQNEFYQAMSNGFKPDFCVEVNCFEYNNERYARCAGERFEIYRAYHKLGTEKTELYLKAIVGDTNVTAEKC